MSRAEQNGPEIERYKARDMAIIVIVVAIWAPATIQPWNSPDVSWIIYAMGWHIALGSIIAVRFDPWLIIISLPLTFLRLFFVLMVYRLYSGKTTVRRMTLVGLASEIQPVVLYDFPLLVMALRGFFPTFIPLVIPVPFLILIGLALVKYYPPPPIEDHWMERKMPGWWQEDSVSNLSP